MLKLSQWLTLLLSLLLWARGESSVGGDSSFVPSYFTAASCPGSVFVLNDGVGLGVRGDPGFGLFAGDFLCADGQLCWFRHTEHRGLTGRQTCCPKPTSSQLISLHSSLWQKVTRTFRPHLNLLSVRLSYTSLFYLLPPVGAKEHSPQESSDTRSFIFHFTLHLGLNNSLSSGPCHMVEASCLSPELVTCLSSCCPAVYLGSHSSRALRVSSGFLAGFLSQPSLFEIRCTCVSTPKINTIKRQEHYVRKTVESATLLHTPSELTVRILSICSILSEVFDNRVLIWISIDQMQ